MKAIILAGGLGTRISEESHLKPKPMIEIGGKPILWHIMKIYSAHGVNDFIVCCGYKGHMIKEYFSNYFLYRSDITFDLKNNQMDIHQSSAEPWKVTLIDTGLHTMTGGRLKRIRHLLGDEPFLMTYGDGVANIDIAKLIVFHKQQGGLATLTAVQPPGRFGSFLLDGTQDKVLDFREKISGDRAWINGGYFVIDPKALDYVEGDDTVWERGPMEKLSQDRQLNAFKHDEFWQPMDTLRDKNYLEELWDSGKAPWKIWDEPQK